MPTFSPNLEATLHRTLALANDRKHTFANLEHFLLALTDDPDASEVLVACKCNLAKLRDDLLTHLEKEVELFKPGQEIDSKPTASFQRVVQRAVIHVQSSGREIVTGANVLAAIFAERESHAAYFLQDQGLTRFDVVRYISENIGPPDTKKSLSKYSTIVIEKSIERSAEAAPRFKTYRGKIRFRQSDGRGRITERKAAVTERCHELQRRCARRTNEQPELKQLVDKYAAALATLRKNRGAYGLFLIGMEIETLLKAKTDAPIDLERNPQMDADLLFAARSLIVAHAGLITLFPDVKQTAKELDQYRELSNSLDAFRERVLDPVLEKLAASSGIFDEETQNLTREIKLIDDLEKSTGQTPTQGTSAIKHSWLRGALASIGQYLLRQSKESAKVARDAVVKEEVTVLLKDRTRLTASILEFLREARDSLLSMGERLPSTFGWISALLSLFGIK
jgi:hypothetical protein